MVHAVTATELRRMTIDELSREIREKEASVAKIRMGLKIGSDKDIARYRRERKQMARLATVMTEKRREGGKKTALKAKKSSATLSAPAK